MSYLHTLIVEDRRLAMLALLADAPGYQSGSPILQQMLGSMGLHASLGTIDAELAWLRDAGLVELEDVGGVLLAGIRALGVDVVKGRTRVPGVARPRP